MKTPSQRWMFTIGHVVVLALVVYALSRGVGPATEGVAYSEFREKIRAGQVSEVEIRDQKLVGLQKGDATGESTRIEATRLPGIDDTGLLEDLEAHRVKVVGRIGIRLALLPPARRFAPVRTASTSSPTRGT